MEVRREVAEVAKEEGTVEGAGTAGAMALPEELEALAAVLPDSVVLESCSRVEQQLRAMLAAANVKIDRPAGGRALASYAEQHGLVTQDTRDAIEGLSVLRNLTAHGQAPETLDAKRALDFAALSDAVLYMPCAGIARSSHA
jgi:hypothetical protein